MHTDPEIQPGTPEVPAFPAPAPELPPADPAPEINPVEPTPEEVPIPPEYPMA